MIKNEDGRRHMSEAIPTEVVSPQFRGWSCRMKESAESGQGHLQLLCAQHFPLGCQRPNNLFKKKLVISAVPGCLELKLNTHTKHTHTHKTHIMSRDTHPQTVPLYKVLGHLSLQPVPFQLLQEIFQFVTPQTVEHLHKVSHSLILR